MCYNASISLNTFIFGFIMAIVAYYTKIIHNSTIIILLSFSAIQLLEYFTWTYYNNKKINKILSYIGLIIILTQIYLLNYYLPPANISRFILILLFIILILFIIIQLPKIKFAMTRGKNKHLIWHWLDLPIIWIIIGLSFYIIPILFTRNLFIIIIYLLVLAISLYFYWNYKTWGSMWCYFSNSLWVFVLIKIIIRYLHLF